MISEAEVGALMRSVAKFFKPQLADIRERADTSDELIADVDSRLAEVERKLRDLEKTR